MGNLPSAEARPLVKALRKLLKARDLRVGQKTLELFIAEVDRVAPWFLPTGHLNLPSWEKLGGDLASAELGGDISPAIRPLWEMIHACLEGEGKGFPSAVRDAEIMDARKAFEQAKSECSREGSVQGEKIQGKIEDTQALESSDLDSEEEPEGGAGSREAKNPYAELRRELCACAAREKQREEKGPPSALWRGGDREPSAPPWSSFPEAAPRREAATGDPPFSQPAQEVTPRSTLSRPLSYDVAPRGGRYFHGRLWKGEQWFGGDPPMQGLDYGPYGVYPVQMAPGKGRNVWEPFEIKQIRELKSAVTTFGPTAPYTIAMLENLASQPLTPGDWMQLAKACLPSDSYLDWRAWYTEFSAEQAEKNAGRGNRGWGFSSAA
ncbi:endogenous retrovirus group K member 5 Gag polyprotein-like isoform X1 [Cavia porcellus]|uniref:endogenous retrovirus group K member 5 Gag polyprotein-like isoform X1 n=1 Tax=Cavia porcellus TaxID=10141 RepID=UPI002FDF9CFE